MNRTVRLICGVLVFAALPNAAKTSEELGTMRHWLPESPRNLVGAKSFDVVIRFDE